MGVETFQYIDDLVDTNPTANDNVSEGDDHIRGIKTTLKNTFPNVTGAVTSTQAELNYLDGLDGVANKTASTGSLVLPAGTTAQQDATPSAGYLRWNTTDGSAEVYDGSTWSPVGGGNTTDKGLYEHSATISADYSITSGSNAMSGGPITVDAGVTVTIPTGSVWTIV